MKTIYKFIFLFLIFFCTTNCGGGSSGTTNVGNSTTTEITISKLVGGTVTVEIPLDAFGDSDGDAATTSLAVYQNGVLLASFASLEADYDPDENIVSFTLPDLVDGDLLTFLFTDSADETIASFAGAVSDDDATTATSTIAAEDLLADANLLLHATSDSVCEVTIARSVFSESNSDYFDESITIETNIGSTYVGSVSNSINYDDTYIYHDFDVSSYAATATLADVTSLEITLAFDSGTVTPITFSPDIGDNLGVWESTTTLYRLGFVGTGTTSSNTTYTLTETGRAVSSGCPGALSSALDVPDTMEIEQDAGRFIYVNGADDNRDWEGIVNDDGTFILLDGIVTTDGSLTSTAVARFDGVATGSAISGTYVVDYDTPSLECRIDIDFVGTL